MNVCDKYGRLMISLSETPVISICDFNTSNNAMSANISVVDIQLMSVAFTAFSRNSTDHVNGYVALAENQSKYLTAILPTKDNNPILIRYANSPIYPDELFNQLTLTPGGDYRDLLIEQCGWQMSFINATFNWGTVIEMSPKCGANVTNDYVFWDAGDLTGFHRVMDFKLYNLG
jgi:hypothetical protein